VKPRSLLESFTLTRYLAFNFPEILLPTSFAPNDFLILSSFSLSLTLHTLDTTLSYLSADRSLSVARSRSANRSVRPIQSIHLTIDVSQNDGHMSTGSEGPDVLISGVMDDLKSFQSSGGPQQPTEQNLPQKLEIGAPSTMVEIVLPTIDNIHEYEYLPGHSKIDRILNLDTENPKGPFYTVRLQSGERTTV